LSGSKNYVNNNTTIFPASGAFDPSRFYPRASAWQYEQGLDLKHPNGWSIQINNHTYGFDLDSGQPERQAFLQSIINMTVESRGFLIVPLGGTASGTVIDTGGTADVYGTFVNTIVDGNLNILSGGHADPTTIFTGGVEVISSGGTDTGALISGGEQNVFGHASGATVFAGSQVVESGGTASGTTVSRGGALFINSSGTSISAKLSGVANTSTTSGLGAEVVFAGGRTSNTSILRGGVEVVSHGGLAVSTTVNNAGFGPNAGGLVLFGTTGAGTASATIVESGAQEAIFSGGTDVGARINKGGQQLVFIGGTTSGTTLAGGV
jgi:autotransporter passenger strand-loop-strand repeat protein